MADDAVPWPGLAVRLSQGDADLVVVEARDDAALDWSAIREATGLTSAPVVAVGPVGQGELAWKARQAGVAEFLDEANFRPALDAVLDRLARAGAIMRRRGIVISVLAPTPGSGGSTVAANLAGALAAKSPGEAALVELTHGLGELALLLNVEPKHTIADVCRRWQKLDTNSLGNSFFEHPSGLRLLAGSMKPKLNGDLTAESVRRIAVLARIIFRYTVLALDTHMEAAELEAMRLSDAVVLVVRPDVPAVRRAQWALERAVQEGVPVERIHLVVNRWGQGGQLKMKQVEESLGLKVARAIPDDPRRVNKAANRGILLRELAPYARISRGFRNLAISLNGK